jgi:hypothetical protein
MNYQDKTWINKFVSQYWFDIDYTDEHIFHLYPQVYKIVTTTVLAVNKIISVINHHLSKTWQQVKNRRYNVQ